MGETAQDRLVVLAVVVTLGLVAVVGLAGVVWLVHDGVKAELIAVVVGMPTAAVGALAGLLAATKTNPSPQRVAEQLSQLAVDPAPAAAAVPPGPTEAAALASQ